MSGTVPAQESSPKDAGGKKVSEFISADTRIMSSGVVTGTLHYVTGVTSFSEGEQDGHFIPVTLDSKYKDQPITVTGKKTKTATDLDWLLRVSDDKTPFTFATNETDVFLTLNFDNANLEKVSIVSAEESVGYDKTGGDLMRNVSITWDATTGTVKGTAKHITGWEQLPSDPRDGHFIAVKLDKTLMGKRFSFTKGTDWESGEESTSDSAGEDEMLWVLRLDKNNKFTFKSDGEIVARLDCSGVTLEGGD